MKEKSRASHSWLGITLLLASAPSSLPGLLYACTSWATLEMPLAECRKGCSVEDMTLDTLVCPCPKWAQKIPWSPLSYNRHYLIFKLIKKRFTEGMCMLTAVCSGSSPLCYLPFPAPTESHLLPWYKGQKLCHAYTINDSLVVFFFFCLLVCLFLSPYRCLHLQLKSIDDYIATLTT